MPRNQHTIDLINYISFGALLIPIVCYFKNGMVWETSLSAYADQHYFGVMLSAVSFTYLYDYVYDREHRWYNLIACISLFGVAWCDMYTYDLWKHYTWAVIFFGNTHVSMIFRVKGLKLRLIRLGCALGLIGILVISILHPNVVSLHNAEWINMIPMAFLLAGEANKKTFYQSLKELIDTKIKR
jgi:hypothetical protein